MFTGLIEKQGEILENRQGELSNSLVIRAKFLDLKAGESIAVNGVCLTLLPGFESKLVFDVSPETLTITTLGRLGAGDFVNLERAMLATMRFGGHYVSGHVDTTATLQDVTPMGEYIEMTIGDFAQDKMKYLLSKGSLTVDGVSLTINTVNDRALKVLLVPHTLEKTTLGKRQPGERLNIEFDYLTRIIAHQVESAIKSTNLLQHSPI